MFPLCYVSISKLYARNTRIEETGSSSIPVATLHPLNPYTLPFHAFHSVTGCSPLVSSRSRIHTPRTQPLVYPHLAPIDS